MAGLPLVPLVLAWVVSPPLANQQHSAAVCTSVQPIHMLAKGFGKVAPPPPPPKKKKPTQIARTPVSAPASGPAADLERLKASGVPEYSVLIRTVNDAGEPTSKWLSVGGLAVPRSSSEDQALSLAIFNNEDALLEGAFQNHPQLKKSEERFEYGYRLREFPDDPVRVASKEATEQAENPILQWFNTLDNPLNNF